MQSFLPILIFWILAVLIGNLSKMKKAAQQHQARQNPQQAKPAPAPAAEKKAAENKPLRARTAAPAPIAPHEAKPLEAHMHTPVMGVEGVGTEGVDCCHEYMLDQPGEKTDSFAPVTDPEAEERNRMLLQGVIFSEILGRRPIRRYGGKRA